ncbi:MAG: DUF1127 domain-containing protein [Rhodospirillales bacterium]|nr:DUF1127 domain-containing protein [Rhodospirillales bacterium]
MKNINDDKSLTVTLSLASWRKRNTLSQELYALNDRMLADVGICRDEIPMIVEKSYPRVQFLSVFKELLAKWATARKNQETARKLAAFDDRMLADIGLGRSDISSIAKGCYPERHAHAINLMGLGFGSSSNVSPVNDDHRRAA